MRSKGLTLLETMATVAVLAVVIAVLAPTLNGAAASADRSARDVLELDAWARLAATREGPVDLVIGENRRRVMARNGIRMREVVLSTRLSAHFVVDGESVGAIRVDGLGRSEDYEVVLVDLDDGLVRWRVAGLTGWAEHVEAER